MPSSNDASNNSGGAFKAPSFTICNKSTTIDSLTKIAIRQWYDENPAKAQRFADGVKTLREGANHKSTYCGLAHYGRERHEVCEGYIPPRLNDFMSFHFGWSWMQEDEIYARFWNNFPIGSMKQTPGRKGANERR